MSDIPWLWHNSDLDTRWLFLKLYFLWEAASMIAEIKLGNMNHKVIFKNLFSQLGRAEHTTITSYQTNTYHGLEMYEKSK